MPIVIKKGGKDQKLIIREEDKQNKEVVESRYDLKEIYGENFEEEYPSKIYEEFEKDILVKMNQDYKDIFEQSYLFFIKETKETRNLNAL